MDKKKMLSVAICTYNGGKYIERQLKSILCQTQPVNEIVICDDGSLDETLQIIECVKKNSPTKIDVFCNPIKIGVCANFQKAVSLCHGDIIFLADQDDIWNPNKVQIIVDWYNQHPDKSVVFSDADLIDENGHTIFVDDEQCKLWDYYFSESDRKMFEHGLGLECMMKPHATGASMAVKKSFLDNNPFFEQTDEQTYHDLVICINAVESEMLGYIDESLFQYRIHKRQVIGIMERKRNNDTRDWRCPYYPDDYIAGLLRDKKNIERIRFLSWRLWTKHRIYGFIMVFFSYHMYHKYYKPAYHTIMSYDIKANLFHTKHRIVTKIRTCYLFKPHRQ